jgi:peptidoglycan hydrolase-like protein with peptidoglycan-binding domain
MEKLLIEELKRIHFLTYGKKLINEQEGEETFIDKILKKLSIKKNVDPNKSDLVSGKVDEFYDSLENIANNGGLSQENKGSMTYQKDVETLQIALLLSGFDLPKHGVDGLFGPETANAVKEFKAKYEQQLSEDAEELRGVIDDLDYDEKGSELTSGGNISNEISTIVANILKDFKKISPSVKVKITAGNDDYHQGITTYKSSHTTGNAIDVTLSPLNQNTKSSFIKVLDSYKSQNSKFSYINEYDNPSSKSTGGHFHLQYGGASISGGGNNKVIEIATPEMIRKIITILKDKKITEDDIVKYIDTVSLNDLAQKNVYANILQLLDAPITEENLKFLYAWRQSEGKAGDYNPFNTTHSMPESVKVNSHGVRSYKTLEDGLTATIKTLKNGRYDCIVNGLKNDIGAINIANCQSLKVWGTDKNLLLRVLAGYDNGAEPKLKSLT